MSSSSSATVAVHGLDAAQGDTAFAFCVLRFRQPTARRALVEVLRYLASLVPDTDSVVDDLLPEDLEQAVQLIAVPWLPPEAGHALSAQRRLIEGAGSHGVDAAWFFQTGTSLPSVEDEDDDDTDDATATRPIDLIDASELDDDAPPRRALTETDDEDLDDLADAGDDEDEDEDDGDDDEDVRWSYGTPPQVDGTRFPVDGYPDIIEELDWEDFGIAVKLAGEMVPGEGTVLLGFHTLWLAPYGGRYRNSSVTIDRKRHAAHLWVDRFAVPVPPEVQVGHVLWILSKLDEVVPIVHARFEAATMAQKYGGLMGDTAEPFVLGGNPLLAVHADGGEAAVDKWIGSQTAWSKEEIARMLRELAIEIVTSSDALDAADDDDEDEVDDVDDDEDLLEAAAASAVGSKAKSAGRDVDEDLGDAAAASVGGSKASAKRDDDEDEVDDEDDVDGGDDAVAEDDENLVEAAAANAGGSKAKSAKRDHDEDEVDEVGGDNGDNVEGDDDDEIDDEKVDDGGDDDEGDDDDEDDDDDDDDDEGDDDDEDDDDGEAEGNEDEDRGRQITTFAGELLKARAAKGLLDPRVAERLMPLLGVPDKFEQRRCAVVDLMGALRHKPAVALLAKILETTTVEPTPDALGREELVIATAKALGAIGDPVAAQALARVVAAPGQHNDEPRAVAADALAACLAATPEPRTVDDAVLAQLLATIRERNDGELNAGAHFAYGRLVRLLPTEKRAQARNQLAETDAARDDAVAMLARQAALVLASPTSRVDAPPRDLASLLHEGLTSVDYDHEYTVRNLRVALEVAELVPDVVEPADLAWLTAFHEADIRARAHALLAKRGQPMPEAPLFDRYSVRDLGDDELVRLIGEARVVGRAALVAEAGKRGLARAKPAIIDACHDAIGRARRGGENLLDPDTRLFEAAVPILRKQPLDDQVVSLFDRMLRHSNYHVKWELLQRPPRDERLIGAMFQVLGEKWGWQEAAAKEWLAQFQGSATYEAERKRTASPRSDGDGDGDGDGNGDGDADVTSTVGAIDERELPNDEDMN